MSRGPYDTTRKRARVKKWSGVMSQGLDRIYRKEMQLPVRKWDRELMARLVKAMEYLDKRRARTKHAGDAGRKR